MAKQRRLAFSKVKPCLQPCMSQCDLRSPGGSSAYTNWNPRAVPGSPPKGYNCMQLLSASFLEASWMTFQCSDTFISTRPLCQLK